LRIAPAALALFVLLTASLAPALAQSSSAELISQFRAKNGEGPVTIDATLNAIAQQQASAMAAKDVLDHDVAGNFNVRVAPSKAGSAAENIAYGYADFPRTLGQWINSSGHRRNLLLKDALKVGIANAKSASGKTYWAMVIAGAYEKPRPKAKQPAQGTAKGAARDKPAKRAPRDCAVRMLGLCF
jgi:uncharacterized protein YkwD